MTYAFLLLTYDNIVLNYPKYPNTNIYIHPKYPDKVLKEYKQYIIKNLISSTNWCDYSIVKATINLLKEAFNNKSNEWFVLLSQDSYPLYENVIERLEKLYNNKSIFNYIHTHNNYHKTSQWWILNRDDVKIIIDTENKYDNKFKYKLEKGCPDEYYFLTVLKWENPNYTYTNIKIMYDKWLEYTIQRSPAYFNCLLKEDLEYITEHKCLFIRKITNYFTLEKYKTKRKLYVIYIGTETNQNDILFNDNFDVILMISIDINNIKKHIIKKSIYIFKIIHKFYYESILNICHEKFITNWDLIIFTTEHFNMHNYNKIEKEQKYLPYNNFVFKKEKLINKKFYYIMNGAGFIIKN
jgi:hypothetical protein